jgi:hypothetical protein
MLRLRALPDGPELASNNLRVPFGIKRDRKDGSALIAQKHQNRDCTFRDLVSRSKCFDDDIA